MPDYGIVEGSTLIARFAAPLTVRSNHPIFASDTLSLKRNSSRRNAQRWEIESNLEPLTIGANDLFVNLVVNGYTETVSVRMPQNYGVIMRRTSTASPVGVGSKGSTSVTVTGNSGLIPKGTFIKFGSHTKVYMLTADLNGSGTMHLYPSLRADVSGAFNHRDDVIMPCLWDTDTISGMVFTDGILMDNGKMKLIERLA